MNIDKDYEDILGKIEIKGCLDFTFGFKAKGIKQTDTGQHLWSIYVCRKKEMKTIYCISVVLVTLRTGNL